MYEPSDQSEEDKDSQDYNIRVNSDEDNVVHQGKDSSDSSDGKSSKGETPLEDTSLKSSMTGSQTQIDPVEKKKKFNPEEQKYPLEYHKYLKVRKTNVDELIRQKRNWLGNFGISLFWEEKVILFIRYFQLYSLCYISVYEYWPYNYSQALENVIVWMGLNIIYVDNGYYTFIEKFYVYLYNLLAWLGLWVILIGVGVTIIYTKKLKHEFKHSKTLLKKWAFNVWEIMFIPLFGNLIPMLSCSHKTTKNGYEMHEWDKYGAQYIFFILSIAMIAVGILYNLGLIYMIRKRKISYRQKDHDGFVKRKELEYVLEISDSWRKQSMFVFSSFKGTKLRLYFKPVFNMFWLFLICTHAYAESALYTKAMIYSWAFTFGALFVAAVRPFRWASTNFLLFFQFAHMCGPMYMVTQNVKGLKHGLLVNTYFSVCLYIMIGIFGTAQLIVVAFCLFKVAKWPLNAKKIKEIVYTHEKILEMMQEAFSVITKLRLKKVETNKEDLERIVDELTDEYNRAFVDEHPFQYWLLELIDELKDTAVVIDDRKGKQEYHFLADFLEVIDDKKSYL